MTPRSLFVIILKVLGIFFLKDLINSIIQFLSGVYQFGINDFSDSGSYLVIMLWVVVIYTAIIYLLLLNPARIIDKLNLDKDFYEEQFTMKMDYAMMINIAILVTGLYMLVSEVPTFFAYLQRYFATKQSEFLTSTDTSSSQLIYSGVKIVIAYILLSNYKAITAYVEKRKNKNEEDDNTQPNNSLSSTDNS